MHKIDLSNIKSATSETARDINRRIVLNLIRSRQPISRAELARLSGLQRSTVSLIVGQLMADLWIMEGPMGRIPRGRRPTYLRLNNNRMILGVDIGPTATRLGIADLNGQFLSQETMPTDKNPEIFLKELLQRIHRLRNSYPHGSWEGIGISLPGRADPLSHRLVFAPNLAWKDVDLKTPIERATGLSVELENAANACVLSEVWFGRNSDTVQDLLIVTVSEGIGTGIFANGRLINGAGGFAGEFGHTVMDPNGPLCSCGNHGCWEVFASNSAALRYYSGQAWSDAENLSFSDLLALAEQGSVRANQALEQMARYLGAGLASLVTGLAPERIIVIGEVTRAWERVGPIILQAITELSHPHRAPPPIEPRDFSTQPRLRGTIALVIQKHFTATTGFVKGKKKELT